MMQSGYIDFAQAQDSAHFRAILAHYGIKAQEMPGDEIKIHCPFHEDNTPSCFVNTTKKLFNCFACGAGGNVLAFVRQMEDLDAGPGGLRAAAIVLAGICGQGGGTSSVWSVRSGRGPRKRQDCNGHGLNHVQGIAKRESAVTNKPLTFRLTTTPDHPFFQSHGISRQMIETFGLGYAASGIMAGRIVIPIHRADGKLVAYAGRHAEEDVPSGVPRYKLPKTFHKSVELFNLHRIRNGATEVSASYVVLVEMVWLPPFLDGIAMCQ